MFKLSAPTKAQLKHDAYLVVMTFVISTVTAWQLQPDQLSKAAAIAAVTAGFATVLTVIKSIVTTF